MIHGVFIRAPACSSPTNSVCVCLCVPIFTCVFTCVCFLSPTKQNPKHTPSREARHITVGRVHPLGITGDWETMAVKAEVWVEAVTKGGRRFMAAWRQEEEDAARHRQEKREATRLRKLQSRTEA